MARKKKGAPKKRARHSIRGLNQKDLTGLATAAFLGGAGSVIVKMVLDKTLPAEYSKYTHYAQIAAGIALSAATKNNYLQAAGLGAATVGAANVVADLTDGVNGLGLLPPGNPQYRLTGLQDEVVKTL